MPERDGYIAGVPCWVDTSQPDPDAAADFYGGLFGWEFEDAMMLFSNQSAPTNLKTLSVPKTRSGPGIRAEQRKGRRPMVALLPR